CCGPPLMFIPLKDNNPSRSYPVVNIRLLLANVVVFLYQLALPPYDQKLFILSNATIPARIPAFLDGHAAFEAAFLPLITTMVLYPRERILTLVFIFVVPIPAVFILGYWFLLQFLAGIDALGTSAKGGVAVWAHVGGFLLGVLLTQLVRRR